MLTQAELGVVVIGRNEGNRLVRSLDSIVGDGRRVVYVDSGSSDSSVKNAEARGADVVHLDSGRPFTAARARQAGFERLRSLAPDVRAVQFVDGDCEVDPQWFAKALETLNAEPSVVAVCGWNRERHPEASIYNRVIAVEWLLGTPGDVTQFTGNVMIRADALIEAGGWNAGIVAAEDDELALRLSDKGGRIQLLDVVFALHDADMHTFRSWWTRAKRSGFAFAQVHSLHGRGPHRKFDREIRRVILWGGMVPSLSLALAYPTSGISLLALLRYPVTAVRVAVSTIRRGFPRDQAFAWGLSCALAPVPQVVGLIKFIRDRARGQASGAIEYK